MVKGRNIRELDSMGNPIDESLDLLEDVAEEYEEREEQEDEERPLTEQELVNKYLREEEQSKYEDDYDLSDMENFAYYYKSLVKKVSLILGAFIVVLLVVLVGTVMYFNSNNASEEQALYEDKLINTSKKLITELYDVKGIEEIVAKNPILMEYFTVESSSIIDFTDEENYLRRFSEFNNEPLTVEIHNTIVNDGYVYISYTIQSNVNANSNRYAILRFDESNKIIQFNEYWQYNID